MAKKKCCKAKKKDEKYENTKLQDDLMKMPELEGPIPEFNVDLGALNTEPTDDLFDSQQLSSELTKMAREHFEEHYYLQMKGEAIHKNLHDINTSYTHDGETTFHGRDEMGEEFAITIPTIEMLHWSNIKYWKEKARKYIEDMVC